MLKKAVVYISIFVCLCVLWYYGWLYHKEQYVIQQVFPYLYGYHDVVAYHKICEGRCDIRFVGSGCGEGKQCDREIEDEHFGSLLYHHKIRTIRPRDDGVRRITPYTAIDNMGNVLGWGVDYDAKYYVLYVEDPTQEIDLSAHMQYGRGEILHQYSPHWYLIKTERWNKK